MRDTEIQEIIAMQRSFFETGSSKEPRFRLEALKRLKAAVISHEQALVEALGKDMRKPLLESYGAELGMVVQEINYAVKHLNKWIRRKNVQSSLMDFPSKSYILREPYGVSLIIGPWNYPVQLTLVPLVGAIAAGNCCVLKPSEMAAHSSTVLKKLISEAFDERYIAVVNGDVEVSRALLAQRFDKIFFTGSPAVGRLVMEQAARHLTPVTLELGGKSPCIVDATVDPDVTAKRILWGKFFNAGQTCVAPDYLLVHKDIKEALYGSFQKWLKHFYTEQPENSPDLSRIINHRHFMRLKSYMNDGKLISGGQTDESDCYIAPTIIEVTDMSVPVMKEEIFGPILPVMEYSRLEEIEEIIRSNPDPLGFYLFSRDKKTVRRLLTRIPFGGGCVNDTVNHIQNHRLPFGGRGSSGMGNYHGEYSFQAFSHAKSILHKGFVLDLPIKYPPYLNTHTRLKKFLMK